MKRSILTLVLALLLTIPAGAQYEAMNLTIRTPEQTYEAAEVKSYMWAGSEKVEDFTYYPKIIDGTTYLPLETLQHVLGVACQVDLLENRVLFGKRASEIDMADYEALAEEAARQQMEKDNVQILERDYTFQKQYYPDMELPVFTKWRVDKLEPWTTVYKNYILFRYQCSFWTDIPENVRSVGSFVSSEDGWFGNHYPSYLVCTLEDEPRLVGYFMMDLSPQINPVSFYPALDTWLADAQGKPDADSQWTTVENEELQVTLSIPADWSEHAVIDTTAVPGDNPPIVQYIPVTRLFQVREKRAYESKWQTGLLWDLARWDRASYDEIYGAGSPVNERVLGCDEAYVYTICTPTDVQWLEDDPVSRAQYEKLAEESTAVLERFYRDNNLQPWHPEELTPGLAVQVGQYPERLYDVNGKETDSFRYGGRVYVPLRGVCELLGISVDWDAETNTIVLGERTVTAPYAPTYRAQAEAFTEAFMQETEAALQKMAAENPAEAKAQGITGEAKLVESRIDSFFYEAQYREHTIFSYDCSFLAEDLNQVYLTDNVLRREDNWYNPLFTHWYLVFTQGAEPELLGMYRSEAGIYQEDSHLFWEGLDAWLTEYYAKPDTSEAASDESTFDKEPPSPQTPLRKSSYLKDIVRPYKR